MTGSIKGDLAKAASAEKAKTLRGFFKTGKGEYGEGDVFLGVTVPQQRNIARKHVGTNLNELEKLISSGIHEHRLTALLVLVEKYQKAGKNDRKKIVDFYLRNRAHVNNWDLVDLSADKILGDYIFGRDRKILCRMARSKNVWERRISIISTFNFIKRNDFEDALKISEMLLQDKHDLIQKAVGWMLREIGKRDQTAEEKFLLKHHKNMPRTTLRYAVERFGKSKKRFYMRPQHA
ncbi:MAG: DNA alkylation repair protein [Candidatus Aenigmarchaeota archaeon]|nr:DNA alkylation repair protein [Candidatus Aenigmarchaeota archaeon]